MVLKIAISTLLLIILPIAGQTGQPSIPKFPFAIVQDEIPVKFPMASGFMAKCKEGHQFLIVVAKEFRKGDKIPDTELQYEVTDAHGQTFKPIAFGFPSPGAPGPFMASGLSFSKNIEIVDKDASILGLFFVVPKKAKFLSLRKATEKDSQRLSVVKNYKSLEAMKVGGYKTYGEIKFGIPNIDVDGWGAK